MQTSAHPISQEELMAYLDGELAPEQAAATAAHLEHCRECQVLAADFQSLSRRLYEWEVEAASFELRRDLLVQKAVKGARTGFWLVRNVWAFGAVAAVVIAGIVLIRPKSVPREAIRPMEAEQFAALQRRAVADSLEAKAPPAPPPAPTAPPSTGPIIIRTAELSLTAREFDKVRRDIDHILALHHGYIAHLSVTSPPNQGRELDATLKVPAAELDHLLAALKRLGHVDSESQSGEEVTQRVVDLRARLSNARNAEQRLTELLRDRSGKLSDVLAVEEQIDNVRGEIEQMQAEQDSLSHQIAFASLDLKLVEEYRARLGVDQSSTSTRLRNAAVDGYHIVIDGAIGLVLFFLSYGPVLLIVAGILFFPVRVLWRKRKRLTA